MDEVRNFCYTDYALALLKGDSLAGEEYEHIVSQLVRYTGLSADFIKRINLRLDLRFCKELLRDERRTVGRLDGRFKGIDKDAAGSNFEFDPSYLAIQGPYTATFNDYVRRELEFETDLVYEILSNLYTKWSYKSPSYASDLNVAESLRKAMSQNAFLKVHVANGYFDLATPFFATEYTFNHLELDQSLRKNITMSYYDAGHMMYSKESCLAKLKKELAKFIS
jgi:carboxypeptidase C (cathepsin A)